MLKHMRKAISEQVLLGLEAKAVDLLASVELIVVVTSFELGL